MKNFLGKIIALSIVFTLSFFPYTDSHAVLTDVSADATAGVNDGFKFLGDHTVTVPGGQAVGQTGGVSAQTTNDDEGTMTFQGSSSVAGTMGITAGNSLKAINADGGIGETVSLADDVSALTLNFGGNGTVEVANNSDITAAITTTTNKTGTLSLFGTSTITGQVGTNDNRLKRINTSITSETATFSSDVYAKRTTVRGAGTLDLDGSLTGDILDYTADGTITVADGKNVTAAVTTDANNQGTFTLEGDSTVTGQVGITAGNSLKAINADGGAGKTVLLTDDVSALTLNFGGDGTVQAADNADITAAITTTTNETGTLSLLGTSTITGQVGTSAKLLKAVNAGAAGETATFSNDVFAVTTTVSGTGTLDLDGSLTGDTLNYTADGTTTVADGKNVTAAVDTSLANQGTLTFLGTTTTGVIGQTNALKAVNFNGGTATLASNINAQTTTVNNATCVLNANRAVTDNFTLSGTGTLNVGSNTLTLGATGVYTQNANTTLGLNVTGTSSGQVSGTGGNAVVSANSAVSVAVSDYVADGTTFTVVDGAGGADVDVPGTITDNSSILSFTGSSSGGDLILTANRTASYSTIASTGNAGAAGDALDSAGKAGATGDMLLILNTLDNASTAQIKDSLDTLLPVVDDGIVDSSCNAVNQSIGAISKRLDNIRPRNYPGKSGISTGEETKRGIEVWAQGLLNYTEQSTRGGIGGYDASLWGVTLGADTEIAHDDVRLGLSGGYANVDVDSKINDAETDIDNMQATLYGSYDPYPIYLDALFSFALNYYKGTRSVNVVNINRTADSDYWGQQYSGYLEGGYTMEEIGLAVTPFASIHYMHLHVNGYTETGAGALNLKVGDQDYDMLESGLGVKVAYPIVLNSYTVTPQVHAKWMYDFIGDKQETTSNFTGGGVSFDTNGVGPARSTYAFGGKLSIFDNEQITISTDYDLEIKEDYVSHYGFVTVKYDF